MAKTGEIKNKKSKSGISESLLNSEKKKRLTINIPASLHRKLKVTAAEKEKTMAEIIFNILEEKFKT